MSTPYNRCLWIFSDDESVVRTLADAMPIKRVHEFAEIESHSAAALPHASIVIDVRNEDEDDAMQWVAYSVARNMDVWPLVSEATSPGQTEWLERMCPGRVVTLERLENFTRHVAARAIPRFEYLAESSTNLIAVLIDGSCFCLPLSELAVGEIERIDIDEDGLHARLYEHGRAVGGPIVLAAEDFLARIFADKKTAPIGTDLSQVDAGALGARLRALRTAAGLTQAAVADRTGIHRPNIARVEAGRHMPSLETLARYAHAIGTSIPELLQELK